jgi:hypothetical protein
MTVRAIMTMTVRAIMTMTVRAISTWMGVLNFCSSALTDSLKMAPSYPNM